MRIRCSKLPHDFFYRPQQQRYSPNAIFTRQIGADISNRDAQTPSFTNRRKESTSQDDTIEVERKVETARPSLGKMDYQNELFYGVLSSPHKLKRVLHKQSLEMKQCYSINIEDRHFHLPQIPNKSVIKQL